MRGKALVFLFWFMLCMSFSGVSLADEKIQYILPYPTANELYDAWSPDGVIHYFAGDAGTILKYDGASLTIMETPTDYPLFCIHGTAENDIWAAGGNDYSENQMDRAVYLHYDGQSWTKVSPPVYMDTATYPPEGIFAVAPDNVWAVDGTSPSLFHYDGTAWTVVLLTIPGFTLAGGFDAIHAFAADDIYAVGSYGQIIHYDGTGWSVQLQKEDPTTHNTSYNLFTDVWGPDPDHVFACANWGQVYGLNQQTGAWVQLAEGLSGAVGGLTLTSIAGRVDPDTADPDICFSSYTGAMYHYNGTVFTEISPSDTWKQNVIRRNGAGSYIVAGGMGRMESFDGQWAPISRIPAVKNRFEHITWGDNNLWFAPADVDERAGVFSWNRGQMTEYKLPLGGLQGVMTGLKALAENDVWAGVQPRGGVDFGIFRFDGTSWNAWKPTNTPYPQPFCDLLRTADGELFIILGSTEGGSVYRIDDGGAVVDPNPDSAMYSSLAEGSDGKVYAAGRTGKMASFSSGAWTLENSGTDKNFTGIAAGNGYVYAVAADRTAVYKTDGGSWQAVTGISGIIAGNDFTGVVHMEGDQFIAILNTPEGYIGGDKGEVYLFSRGQAQRLSGWISPTLLGITRTDTGQFFITGDGGVLLSSRGVMQGDVDMSLSVDLRDVLLSLGVQTGEMSAPERADWAVSATDIGNDDKVTMQDTLFILQSLAGQRAVGNP